MSNRTASATHKNNGRTPKDPGYAIHRILSQAINKAPKPTPTWIANDSAAERRRATAPGLAWGWLQRTLRNGEAAIKLEKSGYGSEAAPLLRSALEHAMRLIWADAGEETFVEVAMLAKKTTSKKILDAQHDGWRFDATVAEKLQQYADASTDDYRSMETYTHLKNAIDNSPEDVRRQLKSMYMAWLVYTATSHPSIDSSEPYIHKKHGSNYMALLSEPRPRPASDCAAVSILALIGAAYGYSRVTGLETYFDPILHRILNSHAEYFASSPLT